MKVEEEKELVKKDTLTSKKMQKEEIETSMSQFQDNIDERTARHNQEAKQTYSFGDDTVLKSKSRTPDGTLYEVPINTRNQKMFHDDDSFRANPKKQMTYPVPQRAQVRNTVIKGRRSMSRTPTSNRNTFHNQRDRNRFFEKSSTTRRSVKGSNDIQRDFPMKQSPFH